MDLLNIAVILSGIDEEYQSTILSGVHEYAAHNDINIAHFVAFGGVLGNEKNDKGEFNIYNLIDFNMIDGVIMLTNTITSSAPDVTENLIKKLREAYIPVSSIDCDIPGNNFFYVGIDNTYVMEKLVRHVIVHHNVKKANYVSGPKSNPESQMRLAAYKNVLAENNIEYDESLVYHGFFRERDGIAAVEKFIEDGTLAEAVICANDAMAIGAVSTLIEHGYRVPEDIIVTGFDNVFNARNYYPQITSVSRPLKQSGFIACQQVHNFLREVEQPHSVILDTDISVTTSCGCSDAVCDDIVLFKKETYQILEVYHQDVPAINQLTCNLADSNDLNKCLDKLKPYIQNIKCEKFFLCLCDSWMNEVVGNDYEDKIDNEYLIEGYTEMMKVPLVYCNGKFGSLDCFESKFICPDLYSETKGGKRYYFSPLHFNDRCIGYSVICNSDFPVVSPLYHTWIMNLSNALENIRQISCVNRVCRKLENMSTTDPLSQIFNRNGFDDSTNIQFEQCIVEHKPVMYMFADMDGMKYINDNFGHKEGDSAIKSMANAVSDACTDNEICARFGGDEFIIFASDYDEEKAVLMMDRINENIHKYNDSSGKPYKIEVSIGWHIEIPTKGTKTNQLISKADQKMYRIKKQKPNRRK